ncbi:MAG: nitroreductase family protein [Candidatus Thorarchaeota archaeon]|jgi:nitroreductase
MESERIPNSVNTENIFDVIAKRRSIRKYKSDKIPDEVLARIMAAARLAPSAENSQPWRFVIVTDQEDKNLLAIPKPQRFIAGANAVVVVIGDPSVSRCKRATWTTRDPIIAADHLVLAATALGYGTCWIAMYESRPKEWLDEVMQRLKIPVHMHIICLIAIGVPDENPAARKRMALEEFSYFGQYGITSRVACVLPISHSSFTPVF